MKNKFSKKNYLLRFPTIIYLDVKFFDKLWSYLESLIERRNLMRFYIIFTLIFLVASHSFAKDFTKVDNFSRSQVKTGDYKSMARKLTSSFVDQNDKVRSIFVWITDNLSYDIQRLRNGEFISSYTLYGKNQKEIDQKKQKIKEDKIVKAYNSGKGICEDYCYLFQAMCQCIGIECTMITGYGKYNLISQNDQFSSNHAWNAVKINEKWSLMDITWAAGSIDLYSGNFNKKFQDGFFMTDPALFIINHFPENTKWQLLQNPVSKNDFINFPILYDGFYDYQIMAVPKIYYDQSENKSINIEMKFGNSIPQIKIFSTGKNIKAIFTTKEKILNIKFPYRGNSGQKYSIGTMNNNYFIPIFEFES